MSALDVQVGGDHYRGFVIQPVEFNERNGLGFLQSCVIKRACRFDQPTGKGLEDLEKCLHEIDILEEFWDLYPRVIRKPVECLPIPISTFCKANDLSARQKQAISAICMYNRAGFDSLAKEMLSLARQAIRELKKTLPTPSEPCKEVTPGLKAGL
jgi:hypothetical protein